MIPAARVNGGAEAVEAIEAAIEAISLMTTANVAPTIHAHWFISEYEFLNCSNCGEAYYTGAESTARAKERLAQGIYYKFCPHCGAAMEGEYDD